MFARRTNWNLEPNKLSAALAFHGAAGKPLLDLTASNPTKCGFEYDAEAILRALSNPACLVYEPQPQGLEVARRAVATYYAEREERVDIEDVILTTSTSEAYSFVFRLLCDPGDEVLVPAPSYPLLDFLADTNDVNLLRYPLVYDYGWHIDFARLERAITERTRAIIVVHPNNPTGHFCSPKEVDELNRVCARCAVPIIADEVFLDFGLGNEMPRSFATNRDVLTFTMSGISKMSGLPQLKLAWLVVSGPGELKVQALARLEVIADTYLSMNAPMQHAAPTLIGRRCAFQKQAMARIKTNLAELDRQLAGQHIGSRLEVQGGWYAVMRVARTRSDEDLAVELLERYGVYVHPGHFFDFATEGHVVVSLITPESEFAQGLQHLLTIST